MINPLNISGALAYSIAKNSTLYKNLIVPVKSDEDACDISESILTIAKILNRPISQPLVFPETDIFARIKVIQQIIKTDPQRQTILCASSSAIEKKTFNRQNLLKLAISIKKNDAVNRETLISGLIENCYERVDMVTDVGEFSVRGEILDIWNGTSNLPSRIVFNVNTVEAIKIIDASSQRSISDITEIEIMPSTEKNEMAIFDYFQDNFHIFSETDIISYLPSISFNGNIELFKDKYEQWLNDNFQIFIVANNDGEKKRLSDILGNNYEKNIFTGSLVSGFILNEDKIIFVTTNEIFSRYKLKIRPPRLLKELSEPVAALSDIKKDDFVVHDKYGIGIYAGLEKITAGGITCEYISILYADNDKLFVPVADFKCIGKYFSFGKRPPKINPLGTTLWERIRAVADEDAKKFAQQLLQTYSERANIIREPFVVDSDYEKRFGDEFVYEETPDQKKAIEDIKMDMAGHSPMERCIFGDTGFGKTEVAMRAALKSVLSGKQVAVLSPTTILVEQHGQTFSDRFADWPVKIETLSRFKTKNEQKETVEKLRNGSVDIVIGTHRLLSKDISFRNLGLLIIDEEHRFGVADKEKIKSLKKNVDCLYLTATPIPRTLSMALSGIKNMSSIETPPLGRQSVETVVAEYDDQIITNAIMYEISRGGQVFFVNNRIGTIENCLFNLKKMLPLSKFDSLHGQMTAKEIEDKMMRFLKKEFDCLISTTIVEAGLDIPNVNTIIVSEAENFGLGQLYQLRGRVGRSKAKAYCYLLYKREELTDISEKRLSAIKEFAKLGCGFRLAMKDLQIRGAGEFLGKRQHGCVNSIGFDMYLKLLEKHSNEIKGIKAMDNEEINPEINISVDAIIGTDYINDENTRISFYKRILTATDLKELAEIKYEMLDRFGNQPSTVENLFEIGNIRLIASKLGILKVSYSSPSVKIMFSPDTSVNPTKIISVLTGKKFKFTKNDSLEIFLDGTQSPEKNLEAIKNILLSFQ